MAAPALRVMLVEDNEVYRSSLELLLGMQPGIEVVATAADGDEALARLSEATPDVVLLDYRIPGTDGTELTLRVRELAPELAVVCLTAEASPEERAAVLAAGAAALAEKGDPIESIVSVIRTASSMHPG